MGICMKEPVFKYHFQNSLRPARRDDAQVEPGGPHRIQIRARQAGRHVLYIHAFACPFPVDAWNVDVRHVPEILGDPLGIVAFVGQIELTPDRSREFGDDFARAKAAEFIALCHSHIGKPHEQPEVGLDNGADAGPADFQNHLAARMQPRPMNLRDGTARQRNRIDFRKICSKGMAQLCFHFVDEFREGYCRHTAAQLAKFGDIGGRQQIDARGENLP
ncbi:hypothetical protein GCM10007920_37180 [Ciceribacter naphthalenivorans]|uniref:Uncharacterized protein n=1 Tax=Sphingomonas psychrolutea TaxID=1259676 RepID=A0ABQ6EG02_9SPHN|nr:hypothetical protein GCM10007920_37180 [Ciceribacter naphthalenivorans]GLT06780.1 hypothetical protein GCM10007926_37180 [Sphingomonas psychrolutea]